MTEIIDPSLSLKDVIGNFEPLFNEATEQLESLGIDTATLIPDHIGFRAASTMQYEQIVRELLASDIARSHSEDVVRGRRIHVLLLNNPIQFNEQQIDCLEIIEPKPNDHRYFHEPIDHMECVISDDSLEHFVDIHPHVPFDTSDINRENNPEIRITLPSGRTMGFHSTALAEYVLQQ